MYEPPPSALAMAASLGDPLRAPGSLPSPTFALVWIPLRAADGFHFLRSLFEPLLYTPLLVRAPHLWQETQGGNQEP